MGTTSSQLQAVQQQLLESQQYIKEFIIATLK